MRVSFIILKMIMIVLVIIFLSSGFRTVGSDERAMVLRFGKILGAGEDRLLDPGLQWAFPYPIDDIVKIPVGKKPNLTIDSFWYYQKPGEILPPDVKDTTRIKPQLDPLIDGYCITRSEKRSQLAAGFTESDYNLVHCKWQLIYNISDPERFFRNVFVEDVKPGQVYFDIVGESVKPLLESLFSDAVVATMLNYTIDEALRSEDRIPRYVSRLLQAKLDGVGSGISVVAVQLTAVAWPRQVDQAFQDSVRATQVKQKTIREAETYAENTLNEAAGPVAADLLGAIKNVDTDNQRLEFLWSQLAGQAQEKIAQARAYRTEVVETARASAVYLEKILPEYQKRPELVIQKIYQDAIEYVLDNVDEKIIIQPTEATKDREIRIQINRDPTIKPKSERQQGESR